MDSTRGVYYLPFSPTSKLKDAARLGSITFLSPEEAAKSAANLDAQVPRAWELWKSRIGKID